MENRVKGIYRLLLAGYGEQGWWPIGGAYSPEFKGRGKNEAERLEICIGAILAQNTSWLNAQKAVLKLREAGLLAGSGGAREEVKRGGTGRYQVKEGLVGFGEGELAELIRSAGYYNVKARKIREFLGYRGEISREGLLSVWGLGEETADSILLYAYDVPVFVVDAYAKRVFSRLGLCREGAPYGEVQELFHSSLPRDPMLFNEYHALIVEHAKRHCRVNPFCRGCPLGGICKKSGVRGGGGAQGGGSRRRGGQRRKKGRREKGRREEGGAGRGERIKNMEGKEEKGR